MMQRAIAILVLTFVAVLWTVAACMSIIPSHERGIDPLTFDTCAEDDPCWDCETMGNLICGPRP